MKVTWCNRSLNSKMFSKSKPSCYVLADEENENGKRLNNRSLPGESVWNLNSCILFIQEVKLLRLKIIFCKTSWALTGSYSLTNRSPLLSSWGHRCVDTLALNMKSDPEPWLPVIWTNWAQIKSLNQNQIWYHNQNVGQIVDDSFCTAALRSDFYFFSFLYHKMIVDQTVSFLRVL